MYPAMQDAIGMDGTLYAVPIAVSASPWETYNEVIWSAAGLSSEQLPSTFPEFLAFVSEWAQDDREYAINEFGDYFKWSVNMFASNTVTGVMMNDLIAQYIDGTLDAKALIRELDHKIQLIQLESD